MESIISKRVKNKAEKQFSDEILINWYVSELENHYPKITKQMQETKDELAKRGANTVNKLNLAIIYNCAYKTENPKLYDMLTPRYLGVIGSNISKSLDAESLYKFVDFVTCLKAGDDRFKNMNIDYKKYSKAMAETKNLEYNRFWMETYTENLDNYEFLLNSNDAESACFLARSFRLPVEDFKKCQDVVLKSNDAELCSDFAENKGANLIKLRRAIVDSKNSKVNGHFLTDTKCTTKQVEAHKNAIFTSQDKNKLKSLVLVLTDKPEVFSVLEKESIIKSVLKSKNKNLLTVLLSNPDAIPEDLYIKIENKYNSLESKSLSL